MLNSDQYDWKILLLVQLTPNQHWFRQWLGSEKAIRYYLDSYWLNSLTHLYVHHQSLYSPSRRTFYRKISWNLEAVRFGFRLFQSLWNLTDTSAAGMPRYLSNCRTIRWLQDPISLHRDFTRFGGKTSYRLVNIGPGSVWDNSILYGQGHMILPILPMWLASIKPACNPMKVK